MSETEEELRTEDNSTYSLMTISGYAVTFARPEGCPVNYIHVIDPKKISEDAPPSVKQSYHLGPFRHEHLEDIMGEVKAAVDWENKGGFRLGSAVFKSPEEL